MTRPAEVALGKLGGIPRRVTVRPVSGSPGSSVSPRVSVVIPCFNYGRFLEAAVRSAITQEGVDVDVIVVDDASPDDSADVAARLVEQDPRITLIRHQRNQGPVETFNDGLAHARGEYLVRLDADDLLTPGSLQRSVALAQRFPSTSLVYGHPVHFSSLPPADHRDSVRSWTVWPGRQWLADRCADGYNVITSPEALMRKAAVDLVGGQKALSHSHDMEMWLRLAAVGDVGYVQGADQAWHRDHPASLSARKVDDLTDLHERRAAFETLFDGVAGALPQAAFLRRTALAAVAGQALMSALHEHDRGRATPASTRSYVEFARDTDPDLESTPRWKALMRRQRAGMTAVWAQPWYVLAVLRRRIRYEVSYRHWERHGTYGTGSPFSLGWLK